MKVPLPDAKGAVRMKGSERLENGRCKVKMFLQCCLQFLHYSCR